MHVCTCPSVWTAAYTEKQTLERNKDDYIAGVPWRHVLLFIQGMPTVHRKRWLHPIRARRQVRPCQGWLSPLP